MNRAIQISVARSIQFISVFRPRRPLFAAVLAMTSILVLGPLALLVVTSFSKGIPLAEGFSPTLDHYLSLFSVSTAKLLGNTLWYAGGATIVSLIVGTFLAFLTERTDIPLRRLIYFAIFATFAVPLLIQTLGWILFLSPRIGLVNLWLRNIFGLQSLEGPLNIYSVWGMIFVTGLGVTSTVYIMLTAVMRMNPELEEAAKTSGAGSFRTFRLVTLPLLKPAYFSVALYTLVILVQGFDAPLLIGLTANFVVLSVRIYLSAHPDWGLPSYGLSASYGMLLIVLAMVMLYFYFRMTRIKQRYEVVGGRSYRPTKIRLGVWKYPALALALSIMALKLAPTAIVAWASFLPFYKAPSRSVLGELTLDKYHAAFEDPTLLLAIKNTLVIALGVPTIVITLCVFIGWLVTRVKGTKSLEMIAFLPVGIPNVLIGLALLIMFVRSPLYGSVWLIVLGLSANFLAYGSRVMQTAFMQLHRDLEDAVATSGVSPVVGLRKVSIPLVRNAIVNSWLWVSAQSMRDLQVGLMVFTTSNTILTVLILQTWERPDLSGASAISMILLMIVAVLFAGAVLLGRKTSVPGGA